MTVTPTVAYHQSRSPRAPDSPQRRREPNRRTPNYSPVRPSIRFSAPTGILSGGGMPAMWNTGCAQVEVRTGTSRCQKQAELRRRRQRRRATGATPSTLRRHRGPPAASSRPCSPDGGRDRDVHAGSGSRVGDPVTMALSPWSVCRSRRAAGARPSGTVGDRRPPSFRHTPHHWLQGTDP